MKRVLFFYLIIGSFLISSCGSPGPGTPAPSRPVTEAAATAVQAAEPEVLNFGWLGKPDTLNPAYAFLTESYTIFDLIYSPLTTESTEGGYVGALAKDWSVSDDGLTWTFRLKDGIKWHNGENLTAGQVAWAINAIMADPDGWAALSGYVGGFSDVSAPDDKTVRFITEYPIANMEYRLSFLYAVYPPDFEGFTTPDELQNFSNFEAIGTGPFKIRTFDKDTGVLILDSNPDFYDGLPRIDRIIFQTFDNTDAMIQALKVGDIDLVNEVPATSFATVKTMENVTATDVEGRYFNELIVNSVDPNHDPAPTGNPALADPVVRQAISLAINKKDIVDIVLQGLASPGDSVVPPSLGGGFWHSPNIKDVVFSPQEAGRILEAAGYIPGTDGVRVKSDLRLEFRLQYPSDSSSYPRIAE